MCFNEDVLSSLSLFAAKARRRLQVHAVRPRGAARPARRSLIGPLRDGLRTWRLRFFSPPFFSLSLPASINPTCLPRLYHASSCRGNAADAGSSWEHVAK